MRPARAQALTILAACAAIGAAVALQVARDRMFPREASQATEVMYIRSAPMLQRLLLSYDAIAADVYWIRAIQYYGGNRLAKGGARRYELLYPMLDIVTTLDPYFNIAYRFGAIFLSEGYPGGPGRPDQAITLLRKGIAARPGKWEYYQDAGFVYYWHMRDYKMAAEWIQRAAGQPGAPNWLAPVAANMLAQGNDRASARSLWQQIAQSEQAWLQRSASRALSQLDALDQIEALEAIVRRVPPPADQGYSWALLLRRGAVPGIPADPAGEPYWLDPTTGRVSVSQHSPLYPMPANMVRELR